MSRRRQMTLRIPMGSHEKLQELALERGCSVNDLGAAAIEDLLRREAHRRTHGFEVLVRVTVPDPA